MSEILDVKGYKVKAGDVVTVTVKYLVLKVYDDGHLLVQKCYDIPASAVTITTENLYDVFDQSKLED